VNTAGRLRRSKPSANGPRSWKLSVMPKFQVRLKVMAIERFDVTLILNKKLAHFVERSKYKPGIAITGIVRG
jgi:hypothetical protein